MTAAEWTHIIQELRTTDGFDGCTQTWQTFDTVLPALVPLSLPIGKILPGPAAPPRNPNILDRDCPQCGRPLTRVQVRDGYRCCSRVCSDRLRRAG